MVIFLFVRPGKLFRSSPRRPTPSMASSPRCSASAQAPQASHPLEGALCRCKLAAAQPFLERKVAPRSHDMLCRSR